MQHADQCDNCGHKDVFVYDTDINTELTGYFEDLISIYTPAQILPPEFPKGELRLLKDELVDRWHIFPPKLSKTKIYTIAKSICAEKYKENSDFFDAPIGIAEQYDPEYLREHCLLSNYTWDEFVESLKSHNRFHSRHINLELFEKFCSFIRKGYKKGGLFYRARISSEEGFRADEMGAPPPEQAVAGRANSAGISFLYLANNVETAIHEVRAGAFDYVTIGTFELQEDIIVIDLKAIDRISPFISEFDCLEHAINKEHLQKINIEMGKTLRRSDCVLDYIPTQYICDFIKSIKYGETPEYAGLEYNSTINPSGINLAVFEPFPQLSCVDIEVYKISEIKYGTDKV